MQYFHRLTHVCAFGFLRRPGNAPILYLPNELKDKEDEFGFTLREAIYSGCVNLDSGVGVYAGSPDTYRKFAPLFDPLI